MRFVLNIIESFSKIISRLEVGNLQLLLITYVNSSWSRI